ncbi:MAG: inorganic phosphate transporter [Pseudonocardiaceae bacterium]
MDLTLLAVVAIIGLALFFDFTNGFHDAANSVATVVATRVLRPRFAVAWAALFNFIAFLVFGTQVANTIGETVRTENAGIAVVFAALVGAIVWNVFTWWLGLPSSSSHALVGGLVGAGLAAAGTGAIEWSNVQKTAVFIVVSPLVGFALAAGLMSVVRLLERQAGVTDDHRAFKVLQLASSAAVSLGHGSNDAQKTMGVIAALLVATGYLQGGGQELPIPLWVVLAAHAAIALGTLSGGWNIIRTMGIRITELRPAGGFSAETGAAVALFGSTLVGAPVSTTHTTAGAITGVGVAARGQKVSWTIARRMVLTWVVTLPAAAACAAAIYGVTRLPLPGAAAVLAVLGALGLVIGFHVWRGAARSTDIAQEVARRYGQIQPTPAST